MSFVYVFVRAKSNRTKTTWALMMPKWLILFPISIQLPVFLTCQPSNSVIDTIYMHHAFIHTHTHWSKIQNIPIKNNQTFQVKRILIRMSIKQAEGEPWHSGKVCALVTSCVLVTGWSWVWIRKPFLCICKGKTACNDPPPYLSIARSLRALGYVSLV